MIARIVRCLLLLLWSSSCERVKSSLCDVIDVEEQLSLVCENVPLEVLPLLSEVDSYWPPFESNHKTLRMLLFLAAQPSSSS